MFGLKRAKPVATCSFCGARYEGDDPRRKRVTDLGHRYGQVCEYCLGRALGWAARESLGQYGPPLPPAAPNPARRHEPPPTPTAWMETMTEEAAQGLRLLVEQERWIKAAKASLCLPYRELDLLDDPPELACAHPWCDGILDMLHRVTCDGESLNDPLDGARGQIIRAGGTPD